MIINLSRKDDGFLMEATNASGNTMQTDLGKDLGGAGSALSPMEAVLSSVAGCSAIDILLLLSKQRQQVDDIKISVDGTRRPVSPRIFTDIHLVYTLYGDLDEKKVERACRISIDKMCSVAIMLKNGGVNITWEYSVLPG